VPAIEEQNVIMSVNKVTIQAGHATGRDKRAAAIVPIMIAPFLKVLKKPGVSLFIRFQKSFIILFVYIFLN
jgi:hypothetical protein